MSMLAGAVALSVESISGFRQGVDPGEGPDVELRPLAERSVILARDGSFLAALYKEDRVTVPIEQIPDVLQDAVIAVEDAAFYDHEGISVRGIVRAVRENLREGEIDQGGSTITQQLVKKRVLTSERTFDRKFREAILALRLEEEMEKREILERYLNTVYFGHGAYGVKSGAERFFHKPLEELTIAESALLAGLISSPDTYDPFRRPEAARERRAFALKRMVAEGFITPEEAQDANQAPLPTTPKLIQADPDDYFTEEVRRRLLADPRLGETRAERRKLVFRGGIRVHTTVDPRLQQLAETAVEQNLPASEFTAALVSLDVNTGEVRALVGGPNFEQAQFNLATQGARQPGSSFKPIALAAWLAAGNSPEDLVQTTAPCVFPMPEGQDPWTVRNYEGGTGSVRFTTLREATHKSSNCAYARLSLALGPHHIADMARRLGVGGDIDPVPSVVLGTPSISPLEMASIYATFAADGIRHRPYFITRVEDSEGNVLLQNEPQSERVLAPEVARTVTHVLNGVIEAGTGRRADIGRPAAGKTGTAQAWRDAWFMGYTPQLSTAVWMGHPKGQISMRGVAGRNVTGGSFPAAIWKAFMAPALAHEPPAGFPLPNAGLWPAPKWIGDAIPGVLAPKPPPPPRDAEARPSRGEDRDEHPRNNGRGGGDD